MKRGCFLSTALLMLLFLTSNVLAQEFGQAVGEHLEGRRGERPPSEQEEGIGITGNNPVQLQNMTTQAKGASQLLKDGNDHWLWQDGIIHKDGSSNYRYVVISYRNRDEGSRLLVYVNMTHSGQISLQSNLLFTNKSQPQQTHTQLIGIRGQFDHDPVFSEILTRVDPQSMIFNFGNPSGYHTSSSLKRSAAFMLMNSQKLIVEFSPDLTMNGTSGTFYLTGLEDMVKNAILVLSASYDRSDDANALLQDYLTATSRSLNHLSSSPTETATQSSNIIKTFSYEESPYAFIRLR